MCTLAGRVETRQLRAGDLIFQADQLGTSMFGVLEGIVRLSWSRVGGVGGFEDIVAGHVFGTGALVMADHRRLGTAKALSDCNLIEMNREKFLFAVQESPMFAIELLASADERIRDIKLSVRSGKVINPHIVELKHFTND